MKITEDIRYIGVNDHDVDLFEGQYIVPDGMSYNSYVMIDEKIASICANQKSPAEFRSACQVVIDNSGDLTDTYRQIEEQLGR